MVSFLILGTPILVAAIGLAAGYLIARHAEAKSRARASEDQIVGDFPLVAERGRHG